MTTPIFAVFVPTAIGAGLITSLLLAVTDLLSQLKSERQRRRSVSILSASTAAVTVGRSLDEASRVGLRSRRLARWVGLVVGGLGVYGLIGSFWNYWNSDDMFHEIAWIWTLSWLASLAFFAVGLAALLIAREGRPLRGLSRSLVVKSHLGTSAVERASFAVPLGEPGGQQVLGQEQHRRADEHAGDDV